MSGRPTDDLSFPICGVCGDHQETGLGYCPNGKDRILWCCRDCLEIAPHVYGVVKVKQSFYAAEARDKAGEAGGAYLEKIGKFSLAELTLDEWREFLDILFRERADRLRSLYAGHVPPF